MADKAIGELLEATTITQSDLFVLEQNNTAKKLSGQTFINDMTRYLDGHGGIQSIAKVGTSGLQDTYRITFADLSTYDFIVTNGAKGDKGDNSYVWIKYSSKNPTQNSDMYDTPDDWMGIYSGNSASAPTSYTAYKWFNIKGVKGDTGNPATLVTQSVAYQSSASGTVIPSGNWYTEVPAVAPGNFLWTRTTISFNSGNPIVAYSVSRYGIDGTGSVSSVAGVSPDETGNVNLTADDVGALPVTGGTMTGELNMGGAALSNVPDPASAGDAANKGYVAGLRVRNLLDNSDFTNPVNQRGETSYDLSYSYGIDRWTGNNVTYNVALHEITVTGNASKFYQTVPSGVVVNGAAYTFAANVNGKVFILPLVAGSKKSTQTDFGALNYYESSIFELAFGNVPQGGTATLYWADLYPGSYTLETLPPHIPKGYAAELAECQLYYRQIGIKSGVFSDLWVGYSDGVRSIFTIPFMMRSGNPSLTTELNKIQIGNPPAGNYNSPSSVTVENYFGGVRLTFNVEGITAGIAVLRLSDVSSGFGISNDL